MRKEKIIIKELIEQEKEVLLDLESFKRRMSKKHDLPCPSNMDLLKAYHELVKEGSIKRKRRIEKILRTRPVRSLSGIVNVSVLTKPYPCPGDCVYCPLQKGVPKSYLSGEPAVERAKKLGFDPYAQTKRRLKMLKAEGHPLDKIDLRIIGGTWSFYPQDYQEWFVKKCFDACNQEEAPSLQKAQKKNEKTARRIIGLSIETRPDFINQGEIKNLRRLGVTKVELGIQSVDDKILEISRRGHTKEASIKATRLLKDAGFKVSYQMMVNLPGSTPQKDIETFEEIFSTAHFRPDLLKIYPCALVKEAPLYKLYLAGKYKPYPKETLIETIKKIKRVVPYYVRIERIIRDIPSPQIVEGPAKVSNLRQVVKKRIKKEGWRCKCIRCREIRDRPLSKERVVLHREGYASSEGKEIFLTFEDMERKKLYSLLRLRIPSYILPKKRGEHFLPPLQNASIIREVHTYGETVPIEEKRRAPQHQGLGKKLIETAEKITKEEFKLSKIAVISAVGAREYYRKIGYKMEGTYMTKKLS